MKRLPSSWRTVALEGGIAGIAFGAVALAVWWWLRAASPGAELQAVEAAQRVVAEGARQGEISAALERERLRHLRRGHLRALRAARGRLEGIVAPWALEPERALRERFVALAARGDVEGAEAVLVFWSPQPDDAEAEAARVDYLIAAGRLDEARAAAWAGAERFESARPRFVRRWYRAYRADPGFFSREPVTLRPGPELTGVRTLDVATSVLLRFDRDGETFAVLKPIQTNRFTNYRGEIAAYRLCPLIHCDISIPHNVEARISEPDLQTLMGLPDLEAVRAIARHDSRLVWFEEDGERWLYGTLKAWVPGFVQFPIEELDAWRHLVDGSMSVRELRRTPPRDALADLAEADPDWWLAMTERLAGTTTFDLAHQLSDMHVLDALINNWDRYSRSAPGSNCQFNHGRFVSIDNGASFHTPEEWTGHDADLRLRRVRRFSRRTIAAIRWMEPEALFEILFPPNPHIAGERERWEWFLKRRAQVLEHVDEQIARSGEERVLVFP